MSQTIPMLCIFFCIMSSMFASVHLAIKQKQSCGLRDCLVHPPRVVDSACAIVIAPASRSSSQALACPQLCCGNSRYAKKPHACVALVHPPRVELGTCRVGGDYSIQLNYGCVPIYFILYWVFLQAKYCANFVLDRERDV